MSGSAAIRKMLWERLNANLETKPDGDHAMAFNPNEADMHPDKQQLLTALQKTGTFEGRASFARAQL